MNKPAEQFTQEFCGNRGTEESRFSGHICVVRRGLALSPLQAELCGNHNTWWVETMQCVIPFLNWTGWKMYLVSCRHNPNKTKCESKSETLLRFGIYNVCKNKTLQLQQNLKFKQSVESVSVEFSGSGRFVTLPRPLVKFERIACDIKGSLWHTLLRGTLQGCSARKRRCGNAVPTRSNPTTPMAVTYSPSAWNPMTNCSSEKNRTYLRCRGRVEYANIIVGVTNSAYTNMLRRYTRDNLSFIHLCCSRSYT